MTTIAATKKQIAGDLQATHSGGLKFKLKTKIIEFYQPLLWPNKFYVGLCGNVDAFPNIINWLSDPTGKPPKDASGDFLVLTEDKKIFTFKNPANWIAINQDFYAVGSGMPFAMSAMSCGKTALEACKIANKFDMYTGMGYTHVDLK